MGGDRRNETGDSLCATQTQVDLVRWGEYLSFHLSSLPLSPFPPKVPSPRPKWNPFKPNKPLQIQTFIRQWCACYNRAWEPKGLRAVSFGQHSRRPATYYFHWRYNCCVFVFGIRQNVWCVLSKYVSAAQFLMPLTVVQGFSPATSSLQSGFIPATIILLIARQLLLLAYSVGLYCYPRAPYFAGFTAINANSLIILDFLLEAIVISFVRSFYRNLFYNWTDFASRLWMFSPLQWLLL